VTSGAPPGEERRRSCKARMQAEGSVKVADLPKVIIVCGYATAGKSTVAAHLTKVHGYAEKALADPVRAIVEYQNPIVGIVEEGGKSVALSYKECLARFGYTTETKLRFPLIRKALVGIGEGARRHVGVDVWIDALLPIDYSGPRIVIADGRHANEGRRAKEVGGMILCVERPGVLPPNDVEAFHYPQVRELADAVIQNDGSLELLGERVSAAVARWTEEQEKSRKLAEPPQGTLNLMSFRCEAILVGAEQKKCDVPHLTTPDAISLTGYLERVTASGPPELATVAQLIWYTWERGDVVVMLGGRPPSGSLPADAQWLLACSLAAAPCLELKDAKVVVNIQPKVGK
jgi:hypothetical protein